MTRQNTFLNYFYVLSFFLLVGSCQSYSEEDKRNLDETIQAFIQEEGLDFQRDENGMYYQVLAEGEGDKYIQLTDVVRFSYVGRFLDGEIFQEITKEEAISYKVTQLIAGWQDALSKLKKGGEIKIILPPYLGYGSKETGVIPANSILVYELKVWEVL